MSEYRQDSPFAVQLELTEGCTLACEFCGVNGIREKSGGFKFMSRGDALEIAEGLRAAIREDGWNPRIEFAMHGEPSMHPQVVDMVGIFREAFGPKISMVMFSNGSGFVKDPSLMDRVLDAGINTIGLDAYEHVNIVPRLMAAYQGSTPVYQYPQQPEHNLHSGRRIGRRDIVVIQDISQAETGNHSTLNTHCGGGMKPEGVTVARCAKPFRELAIRWDGNVALCCNDFRGIYKVGNIMHQRVNDLWNFEAFQAARRRLMQKDRNFGPCQYCNAKSMRVGLLPDKKGKADMGTPTPADTLAIAVACAGQPYTPPVRRAWEAEPGQELFPADPDKVYPLNIYDAKKVQP
jgi:radical SAM protein with 4Fe4S-binding SPASM domain